MKIKHCSKYPIVNWQFLENGVNLEEKEKAYRKSKEYSVDVFTSHKLNPTTVINQSVKEETYNDLKVSGQPMPTSKRKCNFLWNSFNITPAGFALPCDSTYDDADCFGDMDDESFAGIWNNSRYEKARKLFVRKNVTGPEIICDNCKLFTKA